MRHTDVSGEYASYGKEVEEALRRRAQGSNL